MSYIVLSYLLLSRRAHDAETKGGAPCRYLTTAAMAVLGNTALDPTLTGACWTTVA
jgi:hypothetical protein